MATGDDRPQNPNNAAAAASNPLRRDSAAQTVQLASSAPGAGGSANPDCLMHPSAGGPNPGGGSGLNPDNVPAATPPHWPSHGGFSGFPGGPQSAGTSDFCYPSVPLSHQVNTMASA